MKLVALLAAVVGVVACGGSAPPPTVTVAAAANRAGAGSAGSAVETSPGEQDLKADPNPPEVTEEQTCKAFAHLAATGCHQFDQLVPPDNLCPEMMKAVLHDPQGHGLAVCAVTNQTCDTVMQCIGAVAQKQMAHEPLRACTAPGTGPVGVPQAEFDHRNGAATKELSRTRSTKDKPIETCGFEEEAAWIAAATCSDGSTPARGRAEEVRVGNLGRGGRCNSIIDQYRITCPERDYDVFVDAYVCAARAN